MNKKAEVIHEISKACKTPYGSLLLEMLDVYDKYCLASITYEEACEYYENLFGKKFTNTEAE